MRASMTAITTLIASISLASVGCDRPITPEPQAVFDHEVFRENDVVPAVGPVPQRVVVNAPQPGDIKRVTIVDRTGPDRPTVTAANRVTPDLDLRYDPATEITIRDVVLGKRYVRLDGDHTGVIVKLQPGGDFIDVLAGTTKYMFNSDFDLQITDKLMVTGSRIVVNGRPLLLAKTLYLGDREILLRDKDNYPLWRDPDKKHSNVDN